MTTRTCNRQGTTTTVYLNLDGVKMITGVSTKKMAKLAVAKIEN